MSGGISTQRCPPLPAIGCSIRDIERRVARGVKAVRRKEVVVKAIAKEITWIQAADILGITARHMRRLQAAGLVEKGSGRGKYRRRRERRPPRGMMVHLDASRHRWLAGLKEQDLVVALDDDDGRICTRGVARGGDQAVRGGQRLPRSGIRAGLQSALHGGAGRAGQCVFAPALCANDGETFPFG